MKKRLLLSMIALTTALMSFGQSTMEVNTKKLGAPIQSTMYGIFFEDINFAADGGLYGGRPSDASMWKTTDRSNAAHTMLSSPTLVIPTDAADLSMKAILALASIKTRPTGSLYGQKLPKAMVLYAYN